MRPTQLEADEIVRTLDRLARRILERFPGAGLGQVCDALAGVARRAEARSRWIARPLWHLRLLSAALVTLLVAGFGWSLWTVRGGPEHLDWAEFIQVLEAGINDIVLVGAAVFFLLTLERRIKRSRALAAIHELRSLAHIVDMHQLTKDPERVLRLGERTASSPRADMTPFQLGRYLDYCSEMLSLVGKVAALYVENFDDPVALAAASDVENLTSGLSRKIWQKIMLLKSMEEWRKRTTAAP